MRREKGEWQEWRKFYGRESVWSAYLMQAGCGSDRSSTDPAGGVNGERWHAFALAGPLVGGDALDAGEHCGGGPLEELGDPLHRPQRPVPVTRSLAVTCDLPFPPFRLHGGRATGNGWHPSDIQIQGRGGPRVWTRRTGRHGVDAAGDSPSRLPTSACEAGAPP